MDGVSLLDFDACSLLLQCRVGSMEQRSNLVWWIYERLKQLPETCIDLVPAYDSLLMVCQTPEDMDLLRGKVTKLLRQTQQDAVAHTGRLVEIPVCFDPELGNDLDAISRHTGLGLSEIIDRLCEATYRVYMLGFLPGFAYMGWIDESLEMPRKSAPVPVRSGAVAIAGRQTGIYPVDSPGGWHIAGFTPLRLFDPQAEPPCLLQPGYRVRYRRMDLEAYYAQQLRQNIAQP